MNQGLELVTQTKIAHDLAVGVNIRPPEIIQKTAALANHLEEAPPAVMVLHMSPEVVSEEVDSFGESRHLDPGGSGIRRMRSIFIEAR
jgi:hypothetical protein